MPVHHDDGGRRRLLRRRKRPNDLRDYLLKGGFLWADDFWGSYAWEHWASELRKVLPPAQYPIRDLPLDHPLFRSQFVVKRVPQIPSINHLDALQADTSERFEDSAEPHARGIADQHGRLMVLITHNTDFGDSWEREGDDPTLLLRVLRRRLCVRDQHAPVRDGTLNESQLGPPSLECHETPWVVHRPRRSRCIGDIGRAGVPAARRRAHAP